MKNKGYAKFGERGGGGQIRCIMRNVEEAYNHKRNEKLDYTSDPKGQSMVHSSSEVEDTALNILHKSGR